MPSNRCSPSACVPNVTCSSWIISSRLPESDWQSSTLSQRTENTLRCVDYSYRNLSKEVQALLLCLAPFTSVFFVNWQDRYVTQLKQQPELASLPFDRWQEVVQETVKWGLLRVDPDLPSYLHLQPILPYFLRSRLQEPA